MMLIETNVVKKVDSSESEPESSEKTPEDKGDKN